VAESKPTIVVTGIAGNLGTRLLPHLGDYRVVGLDLHAPALLSHNLTHFEEIDLGQESSCARLVVPDMLHRSRTAYRYGLCSLSAVIFFKADRRFGR